MTETRTAPATAPRFRYIGTTDECVDCERPGCPKVNLKATIVLMMLDAEGNDDDVTYYGSTCAAKVLGMTGRGQGAKVLDKARFAHQKTIEAAKDARRMLGHYGLPETGQPDVEAMMTAVDRFQDAHRVAIWFNEKTRGDWFDMVRDMLARRQAQIADAKLIGFA
jgi:hypothetical protein